MDRPYRWFLMVPLGDSHTMKHSVSRFVGSLSGRRTLLQVELLDARLVGSDGGALDTN